MGGQGNVDWEGWGYVCSVVFFGIGWWGVITQNFLPPETNQPSRTVSTLNSRSVKPSDSLEKPQLGWKQFPVVVLSVEAEMRDPFRFPCYSGSLYRGVLGWALREVCSDSLYHYLFETKSLIPGQSEAARPLLIVPSSHPRELCSDDRFSFSIKIFGNACDHLQTVIEAVRLVGRKGLGRQQARFDITRVLCCEGHRNWVLFDQTMDWRNVYYPLATGLGAFRPGTTARPVREISLKFLTPTRLIHRGERVTSPSFAVILKALARRVDGLLRVHGGTELMLDSTAQLGQADEIACIHRDLTWCDWERNSNRQKRRHLMGGFTGTVTYAGGFEKEWLDLLGAGQVVHLGKASTFGMGCYQLQLNALSSNLKKPPSRRRFINGKENSAVAQSKVASV